MVTTRSSLALALNLNLVAVVLELCIHFLCEALSAPFRSLD
jgi:hypothetical protein